MGMVLRQNGTIYHIVAIHHNIQQGCSLCNFSFKETADFCLRGAENVAQFVEFLASTHETLDSKSCTT